MRPLSSGSTSTNSGASHEAPGDPGPVLVGAGRLTLEDVLAAALRGRPVVLAPGPEFRARVEASRALLKELLRDGAEIYGVNTGYGDSCTEAIPAELLRDLPAQLVRYHGCGLGRILEPEETVAVLVARLNSLAQGCSAVRFELLEAMAALINRRILPRIPAEGSVGASGDLTPLSYLAAALMGEREVLHRGRVRPAREALAEEGLPVLELAPKEALAIMNGTAAMTGLACLAFHRAEHLSRLACRLTALAVACLQGNREHFHPRLSQLKPHAGQGEAAAWIYADLAGPGTGGGGRIQDRYSIRCAPHVIGVLRDALPWIRRDLENELNSANDNPLFDPGTRLMLHGGHFYGGHVAFAMDALKAAVAGLACLAYQRAEHLSRAACRLTAFTVACLQGNRDHFHPRLSELKPHAGQGEAAAWIFADLGGGASDAQRLQDHYSVRCAPHVIGVLRDALPWIRRDLENEINSANDNPLFDGQARLILHGGHFYGGHVAFAMDALKVAVANLADLMDRQLALLVDPRYSNGLPANLSGAEPGRAAINHGLKAVQIGASAWTAEALKLTMPASVFSRSTDSHNQDKVSLGTISARDCLRVLELTGQVAAALALATAQGLELRRRQGVLALERLSAEALTGLAEMSAGIPFVAEDRPLDIVLRALCADLQACRWSLYP